MDNNFAIYLLLFQYRCPEKGMLKVTHDCWVDLLIVWYLCQNCNLLLLIISSLNSVREKCNFIALYYCVNLTMQIDQQEWHSLQTHFKF